MGHPVNRASISCKKCKTVIINGEYIQNDRGYYHLTCYEQVKEEQMKVTKLPASFRGDGRVINGTYLKRGILQSTWMSCVFQNYKTHTDFEFIGPLEFEESMPELLQIPGHQPPHIQISGKSISVFSQSQDNKCNEVIETVHWNKRLAIEAFNAAAKVLIETEKEQCSQSNVE
jgi:hypothetical protein